MRVGSIVECVGPIDTESVREGAVIDIRVGEIYTVNWIEFSRQRIGLAETNQKQCYAIEYFREIEFPPALEQEIKELISEPIEL